MGILAKILADYVLKKGMIKEDERIIYQYGFQTGLEKGLSLLLSFLIAVWLHMLPEGILFFVIFIPLRSYAGGLHLEHYYACLLLSCLIFFVVLLSVRYINVSTYGVVVILGILIALVWLLNPVDHVNRTEDKEEIIYFSKKLKYFLLIDILIVGICIIFRKNRYLLVITATFLMVVITMAIGKLRNYKVSKISK